VKKLRFQESADFSFEKISIGNDMSELPTPPGHFSTPAKGAPGAPSLRIWSCKGGSFLSRVLYSPKFFRQVTARPGSFPRPHCRCRLLIRSCLSTHYPRLTTHFLLPQHFSTHFHSRSKRITPRPTPSLPSTCPNLIRIHPLRSNKSVSNKKLY